MRTFEEIFADLNDDSKRMEALVELNDYHSAVTADHNTTVNELNDTKKKLSDMTNQAANLVLRVTGAAKTEPDVEEKTAGEKALDLIKEALSNED